MTDLQKAYTAMISEIHKSVLKPRGFKKDGASMRRITTGERTSRGELINFQKSQWNDAENLSFTINAAKLSTLLPRTVSPSFKVWECPWESCRRPGGLIPSSRQADLWWTITDATDMQALTQELSDFLTAYALPWLEQ